MKNLYTCETKSGNTARIALKIAIFMVGLVVGMVNGAMAQTTFDYIGSSWQTYTVPAGVTSIKIDAYGAQGGKSGGNGALVSTTVSVTPGQQISVIAAQQGQTHTGGWPWGGASGTGTTTNNAGGGGGASLVDHPTYGRIIIAAGGGGAGGWSGGTGGAGGQTGSDGGAGQAGGGYGASQSSGGSGGYGYGSGTSGTSGGSNTGGNGGSGSAAGGGGGGGGYFGGGGGGGDSDGCCSDGGGGGGASSYSYFTASYTSGSRAGNGQVVITPIIVAPSDPTSISATVNPICSGSYTTLTANNPVGTVYWFTSGCNTSGSFTSGNSISVNPSSTTNYYARNYNNGYWSAGCASTTVTVNTPPSISSHPSTSPQTLCLNGTPTALSVTASGTGLSYQWYYNTSASNSGGTSISGTNSSSYTPPTTAANTRYYYCTVSGTCTPSVTSNVSGAVTINAAPVSGTLTPNVAAGAVCAGTSVSATATAGSGGAGTIADVLQYRYDGGTWTTYTSGTSLTTTGHTSVSIQTYRTASASGCTTSSATVLTWTVNALPAISSQSTAAQTLCLSGTASAMSVTASGAGLSYQWYSNTTESNTGGTTLGTATGAQTANYTPLTTSAGVQYYYCIVSGTCTPAVTSSVSGAITINAIPVSGTLTPNVAAGAVCAGTSVSATAAAGSGGAGTIADVLQYKYDAGSWTTYTSGTSLTTTGHTSVSIQTYRTASASGCTTSSATVLAWTVNALPAISSQSTAAQTICLNGTATAMSVTASGAGISYQWYSNTTASNSGGTSLEAATGAQTATYTPLTTSVGAKYYYCIVGGTCTPPVTSSVSGAITINAIPVSGSLTPSVAAGGVCVGTSVSAASTAGSGGAGTIADVLQYRYDGGTWTTYTSGTSLTTTGHTSASIQTYRTASASGCTSSTPVVVTWTVNALPTVATITGTTTVCSSFTTTLSCTTVSGVWSSSDEPKATVNSSGVVSGVAQGTPVISYTVTNGSGCSAASTKTVTVTASLAAPTSVTATPATIQTGGTSNLTATSTNNTIYWYTAATGGSSAGSSASGANFSVSPAATTTYYAEANSTQSFYINTLTANNYAVTDHNSYTSDDRGGIAVTSFYYYYTGDDFTVRYTMPNLTNPLSCTRRDGLFSDLGSGTLYTLHNGTSDPVHSTNTGTFNVTNFRTLSADLATIGASASVTLSSAVSMSSGSAAIYAGSNFVILQNSNTFYRVDIPSGTVTNMGSYSISRYGSESWATWGVAELNNGVYSVLYRENSTQAIKRLNLTTGGITTATTFTNLSDMCCFTYSPWNNRWYYHYESSGQFGGTYETAGYADGTHTSTSTGCPSATRIAVTVTISDPPTVTTAAITNTNATTATGGGNVTAQGGSSVTVSGVCWGTAQNPSTALSTKTTDGTLTGAFTTGITGLTAGTLYYVKAYATNTQGTSYGSQVSFTTYSPGVIATSQIICSGANPMFFTSTSAAGVMPAVTYQWQSSPDNLSFNNISGAMSLTYQSGAVYATTYFRRNAISGAVTLSSNVITVTIDTGIAAPTSATATPAAIQSGQSSNLSATSAGNSIYWYTAATGGTAIGSSSSGANLSVSPTVTSTYYAEAKPMQSFYVNTLTANNSYVTDHNSYTADDRGGIAVTSSYYYYTGDSYSVRYDMPGLTNPVSCTRRDGLFSDLATGILYTLYNGSSDPVHGTNTSPFNVTSLKTMTTDLSIGSTTIALASAINMTQGVSAIYAGGNFVILQSGDVFYRVDIPSGTVTTLGTYTISRYGSESWATWGVAELNSGVYSVLFRENGNQLIRRLNLSTGAITTVATFTNLSDMCSFTYSPWHNRWYFHYESGAQFGGTTETAGYADGTHTISNVLCQSATRSSVVVTISNLPTVTTATVTDITATTATGGGNVTADGGATVTARGVCWSTAQTPVATGNHTTNSTGTGAFTSSITGLTAGTTYYVRAYATNAMGTNYGDQVSFTPFQLGAFANINKTYGNPAFVLVNPTSASPGSFSYTSSNTDAATISGNTVTIAGAGTSTITATQAASGGYGSAQTTCTLTVSLANQSLTFTIPTSQPLNYFTGGNTLTLTAASSSGLDVTVAINTGASSATATLTATATAGVYTLSDVSNAGTIVFVASQAGNANYNAASLSQSFIVTMGNQLITFSALPTKTYGDVPFSVSASGGASGNAVTFTSSNTAIASCTGTNGTTVTIIGAGSCLITANQAGNASWNAATAVSQALTVNKAAPEITFDAITKVYADAPFTLSASSASTGAYTYSSGNTAVATVSGSTATITGVGTSTLTANQAADANYLAASANATLTVSKANQTITLGPIADLLLLDFESNPIPVTATASSGLQVTLTVALSSVATLNGSQLESTIVTGDVTVYADQPGDDNYNAASQQSEYFVVGKADQTITFAALPVKHVGDADFDLTANSSSNLPVSYANTNTAVVTINDKTVTISGAGTTDITASQAGNIYYNAASSVMRQQEVQAEVFNTWTGGVSTAWDVAGNWSSTAVPTASDNVLIPASPVRLAHVNKAIDSPALCNKLTIANGAILTIDAAKALTVNGTFTNANGAAGLIIQSDATGTGSLLHTTPDVNATIKRFVTGNTNLDVNTFHLVAVPLTPASVSAQNLFLGAYLYDFDESANKWNGLSTSTTNYMDETRGYMIYTPEATHTYQFAGAMNAGTFTPLVTFAGSGNNLVPNPYPSAIDWDAATGWDKTNIAASVYVWPSGGSNYATYVGTTSANGGSNIIPAGQAFIVRATATPTFTMTDDVRVHNSQSFFKSNVTVTDLLRIKATSNQMTDETVVRFTDQATADADSEYDAWKLYGSDGAPQLYTLAADNEMLSINSLPYESGTYTVPMNFEQKATSDVSFAFSNIESFDPAISIHLQDLKTGTTVNLRGQNTYTFSHSQSNDAKRFRIIFGGTIGIGETLTEINRMWISGNMLYINTPDFTGKTALVNFYTMTGQIVMQKNVTLTGLSTINLDELKSGVVVARLAVNGSIFTTKGILIQK